MLSLLGSTWVFNIYSRFFDCVLKKAIFLTVILNILRRKVAMCCLFLATHLLAQESVGEKLSETRALLEEWVRTETLISEEATQWKVEKRILKDIAQVAGRELEDLERGLQRLKESETAGESARDTLLQRQEELQAIVNRIELRLPTLEASLLKRLEWFPAPLLRKVELYEKRIPRSNDDNTSFLVRAQNIAVILREADDFNSRITLDKPTLKVDGVGERVFDVLYFGLATAYFVDATGKVGGIGVPAKGGWKWKLNESIASLVRDAVQMREKEVLAEFLGLPFQIDGGGN